MRPSSVTVRLESGMENFHFCQVTKSISYINGHYSYKFKWNTTGDEVLGLDFVHRSSVPKEELFGLVEQFDEAPHKDEFVARYFHDRFLREL